MSTRLNVGFLPLVDSATLVIAREMGFASEENIELVLHRHHTWSLIRDKLAMGDLDAAIMLAPMPIAMSLGLGGVAQQVDVISTASSNGNVVGVSPDLASKLGKVSFGSARQTGEALQSAAGNRLRFGVPFPFSMHKELTLYWLEAVGFDTSKLELCTVAPSQMADAIAAGELDAFCVGEPWGSVTMAKTGSRLILPSSAIWALAPEKVLAARHDWLARHEMQAGSLFRALWRAARWVADPQNLVTASEVLSHSDYLDVPAPIIDRALNGRIVTGPCGNEEQVERFVEFFAAQTRFPWRSHAIWIADRLSARHGLDRTASREIARACFRTDLYRRFIEPLNEDTPGASEKVEGAIASPTAVGSLRGEITLGPDVFFDGQTFDPA